MIITFRTWFIFLQILVAVSLVSCANSKNDSREPDRGRIIHKNSVAVVGPLLDAAELVSTEVEKKEEHISSPENSPKPLSAPMPSSKLSSDGSASTNSKSSSVQAKRLESSSKGKMPTPGNNVTSTKKSATSDSKTPKTMKQVDHREKAGFETNGMVKGSVKFLDEKGESIQIEGSIVVLKPLGSATLPRKLSVNRHHVIDMENKAYSPQYIAVNRQDTLAFVNKDKIKHNVFSSSGKNAFDLGTYGAGKQRTVKLGETGIVKVYCNIHPEMATFVSVNDNALHAVSDVNGSFEFSGVKGGEYELHVWHIRGEKRMNIQVSDNAENYYSLNVETAKVVVENHKNKFGKDYSKNSALFEDEFY